MMKKIILAAALSLTLPMAPVGVQAQVAENTSPEGVPATGMPATGVPAKGLAEFLTDEAKAAAQQKPSLLRATQIRADNLDSFPRSGPDAIAGIGDWWLSDGTLCAAISDVGHDAGIVSGGGTLIDLGYCDRADDQWTYANVLTGLAKETAIPVQQISANLDGEVAEIIAVGQGDGLRQTLTYRLREGGDALELDILLERVGDGSPLHMSGLFTLHSQRALTPFSLSSYNPTASLGFQQRDIDRHDTSSLLNGLMPADWNILVGATDYATEISYGVQLRSAELIKVNGSRLTLPRFLAVFPDYSLHGWMTRPLWFQSERLNMLSMLQNRFMDLREGERLSVKLHVRVGDRSEVAAITDQIYAGPKLRGYSDHRGVSFAVWDQDDRPVTQVRPAPDGSFDIRVPARATRLRITASTPWGEQRTRELTVADQRNDSGRWIFKERGSLALPSGVAMSLYVQGLGETPDPRFGDDLLGFSEGGHPLPSLSARNRIDLAGVDSDPAEVELPAGQYRVLVTRGLEYGVSEYLLTVVAGQQSQLPVVAPKRVWDAEGWRSADLHVHSGASFDSTLPFDERLRSFVAQGAEILVASEHNRIVDQRRVVGQMGLEGQVQVVVGSELTGLARAPGAPYTIGHSNVFPVKADPSAYAGGIPRIENRPLREVIAEVKARDPGSLFQLNHPRASKGIDRDLAFFDHLSIGRSYDPTQSLDSEPNLSLLEVDRESGARDIDFDMLEVLNGDDMAVYEQQRQDWFSLLNQGARRTATGNSDSHGLGRVVAAPRNYIYMPDSESLPVSQRGLVAALSEGRSFLTTGPLLQLTLRDRGRQRVGLGGTFKGGRGSLHVQIDAAPWVPVEALTVWLNGEIYRQLPTRRGDHVTVEVVADRDAYLVVEVRGKTSARYRALMPGLAPLALSNPIYIDADGNGKWEAPLNDW